MFLRYKVLWFIVVLVAMKHSNSAKKAAIYRAVRETENFPTPRVLETRRSNPDGMLVEATALVLLGDEPPDDGATAGEHGVGEHGDGGGASDYVGHSDWGDNSDGDGGSDSSDGEGNSGGGAVDSGGDGEGSGGGGGSQLLLGCSDNTDDLINAAPSKGRSNHSSGNSDKSASSESTDGIRRRLSRLIHGPNADNQTPPRPGTSSPSEEMHTPEDKPSSQSPPQLDAAGNPI